jgi:hypothetical protein
MARYKWSYVSYFKNREHESAHFVVLKTPGLVTAVLRGVNRVVKLQHVGIGIHANENSFLLMKCNTFYE